jgi:hypothetical protein
MTIVNTNTGGTSNPTVVVQAIAGNTSSLAEGISTTGSGGSDNYGISARATGGSNYNVAVYGLADNAGVTGIGVFGQAVWGVSSNYGVYGQGFGGGNTNFGGYFDGDVFTTGTYLPSDEKLKKNIENEASMLEKLMQLRPVSYQYKSEELKYIHLPNKLQHGFVAQELQQVFPEAVKQIQHPVFEGSKLVRTEDIVAVNYQSLIPVLIKAVQEQQVVIEDLKKQVNELSSKKITRRAGNTVYLSQALPNPANASTTIKYSIPTNAQKASIEIYDINGTKVLQFNNLRGTSQIVVNSNQLPAGTYVYTLLVAGKETISNKFVVAKG